MNLATTINQNYVVQNQVRHTAQHLNSKFDSCSTAAAAAAAATATYTSDTTPRPTHISSQVQHRNLRQAAAGAPLLTAACRPSRWLMAARESDRDSRDDTKVQQTGLTISLVPRITEVTSTHGGYPQPVKLWGNTDVFTSVQLCRIDTAVCRPP